MQKDIVELQEREPHFKALIPFIVFVVFYTGLSIAARDFYSVSMPVAFLVASASAILLDRRISIERKVDIYARGMGDGNIMIMCLIFILAGAFAASAKAMGAVDSTVLIARHLIPENLIVAGFFVVSCFISLAIGTSCGTIAALTPIALGLVGSGGSAAMMIGAVVGGSMFGDNMSMISDTTIAAARTQNVNMRDKFVMNFKMAIPAAVLAVILYLIMGRTAVAAGDLAPINWKNIVCTLPYLGILLGALVGLNVMALLFMGTVISVVIGCLLGGLNFFSALNEVGKGALGMAETLIVALLAGGLLSLIRHNGGVNYILDKIENAASGRRGCEFGIALLVSLVNLFTANNTVAIVVAGPIARNLADKYNCDPRRSASILDIASCVVQGLLPYGAQILIAVGIAQGAGLKLSPLELAGAAYYPMLLAAALIVSIVIAGNKKH